MEEDLQHLFNIFKAKGPMLIHAKFEKDPIRNSWVIHLWRRPYKNTQKNQKIGYAVVDYVAPNYDWINMAGFQAGIGLKFNWKESQEGHSHCIQTSVIVRSILCGSESSNLKLL